MRLAAVVVLILLGQDKPLRDPWDGFAAGSWIQSTQTVNHRVTTVTRDTRGERARDLGPLPGPETGLLLTGRRLDTLSLQGRRLDCEVFQYAGPDDEPSRWVSLTVWKARGVSLPPREVYASPTFGLPSNVVKLLRCELRGDQLTSLGLDVIDLDRKITVNGAVLDSSVEDVFTTTCRTGRETGVRGRRRWVCDAIPGRIARRDETCIAGTAGGYYTMSVTDFKAVR